MTFTRITVWQSSKNLRQRNSSRKAFSAPWHNLIYTTHKINKTTAIAVTNNLRPCIPLGVLFCADGATLCDNPYPDGLPYHCHHGFTPRGEMTEASICLDILWPWYSFSFTSSAKRCKAPNLACGSSQKVISFTISDDYCQMIQHLESPAYSLNIPSFLGNSIPNLVILWLHYAMIYHWLDSLKFVIR